MEARLDTRRSYTGRMKLRKEPAPGRNDGLRHVGFELNSPGQFRLWGLDRNEILYLVEGGFGVMRRFGMYKPCHVLR